MSFKLFCFSLVLSIYSLSATAGSGQGQSHNQVNQFQAKAIALKVVTKLANNGKVDISWKSTSDANSEKKKYGNNTEWVVSFINHSLSDPKKQTLYIFLSLGGDYIAANYTGK